RIPTCERGCGRTDCSASNNSPGRLRPARRLVCSRKRRMLPARPLRFCMVTTFYPPYHFGGDGMFVYRLAETLAARGHRVDVVHPVDAHRLHPPAEPEVAFSHHPNVTRYPLKSAWPLAAALAAHQLGRPAGYGRRLREILNGQTYDVIHYHNVSLMGGPGVLR